MSRALGTALLLAIASTFLRTQFISFPIGDHPDEKIIAGLAERAVDTGKLTANWEGFPESVWWSRPTYQFSPYTIVENGFALLSNRLSKWPASWEDQVVFARWFSVAVGGLAVFWCYLAAMAWFNDARIALVAELFMGSAFLHVQDSSYGRVEAMLSLAILVAYWAAARVMNRPSFWRCLTLGLAIGLAIAVKYNAAPVALLALAPLFAGTRTFPKSQSQIVETDQRFEKLVGSSDGPETSPLRLIAVTGVAAVVGFLFSTPEVVARPSPLLEGVKFELNHYSEGHPPHQAFDASDGNVRFWWNYFARLGFGWAPTLSVIGFLISASMLRARNLMLAIALLGGFGVLLVVKVRFERNAEILFGPMCIAAASFVVGMWDAASSTRLKRPVWIAVVVGIAGNAVQHGTALFDLHRQHQPGNRPLNMIPVSAREVNALGQEIRNPAPPNWNKYPVLLLYGFNDPFSRHGLAEWNERLKDWDVVMIESPWYAAGYPFSTVETYHGPGFVLRASRRPGAAP